MSAHGNTYIVCLGNCCRSKIHAGVSKSCEWRCVFDHIQNICSIYIRLFLPGASDILPFLIGSQSYSQVVSHQFNYIHMHTDTNPCRAQANL